MSSASALKKSKTFIKKGQALRKEISFNPNYFLTSWSDTVGYLNIKNFYKKNFSILKKYKIILREFFLISKDQLEIRYHNNKSKYKNLILTYFIPKNLKKDGSYFDKYTSLNTKFDKNTLWILIPVTENKLNNRNNENILILKGLLRIFIKTCYCL